MPKLDALANLRELARKQPEALVGFSGGKDSFAVLDLATRTFKRVVAFHFYHVPGLQVIEQQISVAKERWGVEVVYYPHRIFLSALRGCLYCDEPDWADTLPELTLRESYEWIMHDTGIPLILTGAKKSDSLARRRFLANTESWDDIVYPIRDWNKFDVLGYLAAQKIPLPPSSGGHTTGIGLDPASLCWLHDEHPEDFQRLLKWFPYAEAAVKRRDWYGVI
jgi:3'-phosphoadenosine 5'-phosphosulfate sulfotransferase (PAPS reductase)/FAD synthetase